MELIELLLTKEREFVSQYMDTSNMTDKEIDKQFDLIVKEITNVKHRKIINRLN